MPFHQKIKILCLAIIASVAFILFLKWDKIEQDWHMFRAYPDLVYAKQTYTHALTSAYAPPSFTVKAAPQRPVLPFIPFIQVAPSHQRMDIKAPPGVKPTLEVSPFMVATQNNRDPLKLQITPQAQKVYQLNTKGYDHLKEGRSLMALDSFNQSLKLAPNQSLILQQKAYITLKEGREKEALNAFDAALRLGDDLAPKDRYRLQNEARSLEQRFSTSLYSAWRPKALTQFELAALGVSLGQSQSLLHLAYRPHLSPGLNSYKVSGFSRILWGYEGNGLTPDESSYQAGIGISFRPLRHDNLLLSAERLISIGRAARDDWLLRAAWSKGSGYTPPFGEAHWPFWSLYFDAAVIKPSDPDAFLTGQAQIGHSFGFLDRNQLTLTPFTGFNTSVQEADTTTVLSEASLGLWLRYYFWDKPYRGYQSSLDLRAEYRAKVSGDSSSISGPLITLSLNY